MTPEDCELVQQLSLIIGYLITASISLFYIKQANHVDSVRYFSIAVFIVAYLLQNAKITFIISYLLITSTSNLVHYLWENPEEVVNRKVIKRTRVIRNKAIKTKITIPNRLKKTTFKTVQSTIPSPRIPFYFLQPSPVESGKIPNNNNIIYEHQTINSI